MSALEKYREKKAELEEELKRVVRPFAREMLIVLIKTYDEVIKDLETEQRAGLKWGEVQE